MKFIEIDTSGLFKIVSTHEDIKHLKDRFVWIDLEHANIMFTDRANCGRQIQIYEYLDTTEFERFAIENDSIVKCESQIFIEGERVIFYKDYIVVGCSRIYGETIKKIYKKWKEVSNG